MAHCAFQWYPLLVFLLVPCVLGIMEDETCTPESAGSGCLLQNGRSFKLQGQKKILMKAKDVWIVDFKTGVTDEVINTFCDNLPVHATCTTRGHPSEHGVPFAVVRCDIATIEAVTKDLVGKTIESVEPDQEAHVEDALVVAQEDMAKSATNPETKFIAGVPVLNYHLAYGGSSLMEVGEDAVQRWTVVSKTGIDDSKMHEACQVGTCMHVGHPSRGGVPFFTISGTEKDLEKALQATDGAASFAEPDTEMRVPEVDFHSELVGTNPWGLSRVGVSLAPNKGSGVHVFVLDTGIRVTHQDFGGRAIASMDMTSDSLVECNGATTCAQDRQGHGSHCAGTVGGTQYGVAPEATLHAVKVLSDSGSGSWSWSYSALDWIITQTQNLKVASMSLGGSGTQIAMRDAVNAAVGAGVVVVVAGGNSNSDACQYSPAFVPAAITVGSIDSADARSYFSNYGSCTDIWAPGSSVLSVGKSSDTATSTLSGTSMACPHVSGAAAILLSKGVQSGDIISSLLDNAISNAITGLRSGDVNKLLYVGADGPPPTPAPLPTPAPPTSYCNPSFSSGPDSDGDCRCTVGSCYQDGQSGCTYSYTERYYGWTSRWYFLATCGPACVCE